ncbi:MAG: flavin reductase family protein [Synergistales bacterium]|nr:flavin reductase family protein [Synergistales bacterium]
MSAVPELDVKALFRLTYGLYVVGSTWQGHHNAQIANAVMQITGDPLCVTTCLHKDNLTTEYVGKSGVFSVSVLEHEVPMTYIGRFGFKCGRDEDKCSAVNLKEGPTGSPLFLDWTLAVLDARVIHAADVHTHRLFVGEVQSAEIVKEGTPLTYADYHKVKKGKSQKNAPTAIFNDVKDL